MLRRTRLVVGLSIGFALFTAALLAVLLTGPRFDLRVGQVDPWNAPELADYRTLRRAADDGDVDGLREMATGTSYVAFRAAKRLAELEATDAATRHWALRRVRSLRIEEPLARRENRALDVRIGHAAEAAGDSAAALRAFRRALPHDEAVEAMERLVDGPYRRANVFLQAGMHEAALEALGELAAPSIEAPSLRALDRHQEALGAYQRWAEAQPGSAEARSGLAWSHWYLGNLERADLIFSTLDGASALYGRALVANRRGEVTQAVAYLRRSNEPQWTWLATSWLERDERPKEALELYLDLAEGTSAYADDAAYRARTLAARLDLAEARQRARDLVPADSFFGLRLGKTPTGPTRDDLDPTPPPALARANALMRVHEREAAVGELAFALRDAEDEATFVALGEALTRLDEYRIPQRAAAARVQAGSQQVRTWRLAYPRAWEERVRTEAGAAQVDPALVWAVMRRESAFYPRAVSRSGAQGLMQVMPTTWAWLAELQEEAPADPFDVEANIRYGTYYLGWLRRFFDGDRELMVASYNRGQGYIQRLFEGSRVQGDKDRLFRHIDAHETREYLQNVLLTRHRYEALASWQPEPTQASRPAE